MKQIFRHLAAFLLLFCLGAFLFAPSARAATLPAGFFKYARDPSGNPLFTDINLDSLVISESITDADKNNIRTLDGQTSDFVDFANGSNTITIITNIPTDNISSPAILDGLNSLNTIVTLINRNPARCATNGVVVNDITTASYNLWRSINTIVTNGRTDNSLKFQFSLVNNVVTKTHDPGNNDDELGIVWRAPSDLENSESYYTSRSYKLQVYYSNTTDDVTIPNNVTSLKQDTANLPDITVNKAIFTAASGAYAGITHRYWKPTLSTGKYIVCGVYSYLPSGGATVTSQPQCLQYTITNNPRDRGNDNTGSLSIIPSQLSVPIGPVVANSKTTFVLKYADDSRTPADYKYTLEIARAADTVSDWTADSTWNNSYSYGKTTQQTITANGATKSFDMTFPSDAVEGTHMIRVQIYDYGAQTIRASFYSSIVFFRPTTTDPVEIITPPDCFAIPKPDECKPLGSGGETGGSGGGTGDETGGGGTVDPNNTSNRFWNLATSNNLWKTIVILFGALSTLSIIIGGIMYLSAAGDSAKAEKGKKTIVYTIVGIIVFISGITIVRVAINEIKAIIS